MVTKALRRFLLLAIAALLWAAVPAHAQNAAVSGWCETGNTPAITSGLTSTTLLQVSYPACTVAVFIHGGALATITQDAGGTQPLSNPFTASTSGQYLFYAAPGTHVDIQLSGGLPFPGFPSPVLLSDIIVGGNSPPPTSACAPTGAAGNLLASNGSGSCQPTNINESGTALTINDATTFTQPLTANLLATFNNLLGTGPNASYFETFIAGTTLAPNTLVKLISTGQVIPTGTSDTIGIIGVYIDSTTAGAGSTVHVSTFGPASIAIDSAGCAAGAAIINSPSTPGTGRCTVTPGTAQVIGQANSALTGAGVTAGFVYPYILQNASSGGGGGGGGGAGNPGGLNTQMQYNMNGVFNGTKETYAPLQFSPVNPAISACLGFSALPCDVYQFLAYQNGAGFSTGTVLRMLAAPVDTLPTRGNANSIILSNINTVAGGTTLAVRSTFTTANSIYPTTQLPFFQQLQTGILSQTTVLGGFVSGVTPLGRAGTFVATDDFSDTISGQALIGLYAGIGLSKASGSISLGVGLDVAPPQSYAQDGTGNCCLPVTETAQNLYGIRIGDFAGLASSTQAGIVFLPQSTPSTPQAYSIWVQSGGRPALFGDGLADSTLTPGGCVQAATVNGIVRLTTPGGACGGTGTPGGSSTQLQYNNGGVFGGAPTFTFNNTNNVPALALGAITTDINPFSMSWQTNNAAQTFGGFKIAVTNTAYNTGTVNFQVCGGAAANICVTVDPNGNVATPGSFASGVTGAAGNLLLPQGPLPSFTIGGISYTNSFMLTAPTSIPTNYQWVAPSAAASGVVMGSLGSNLVNLANSGDANHALRSTGKTSALVAGTPSLCTSGNCGAGEYEIHLHLTSTVVCATPGPATITPTITFTDDAGTKTAQAMALVVNGGTTLAATMALGNATNSAYAVSPHFWSTGVNPINLAIGYTACTSGTGTYSYSAEAVQLQ